MRIEYLLVLPLLLTVAPALPNAQIVNETYRLAAPNFLPSDGSDRFGESSDISNDGRTVLAVVRRFGAVVFHRNETEAWEAYPLEVSLPLSNANPWRVALSGDGTTAVLGAQSTFSQNEQGGGQSRTGVAFVFRLDEDVWREEAVLVGSDANSGDRFGTEVDVSDDGSVVIVGATYHNHDALLDVQRGLTWGAAYIFVRDEAGNWNEATELMGERDAVLYGREVEISPDGNALFVSSFVFPPPPGVERVSIYDFQTSSGALLDTTFSEISSQISVSSDGHLLILGPKAYEKDPATGTWVMTGLVGASADLFFGREVAVANRFSPDDDRAGYVFQLLDGEWQNISDLVVSDEQSNFSYYPARAGQDWAVLGVPSIRAVYIFDLSNHFHEEGPIHNDTDQ